MRPISWRQLKIYNFMGMKIVLIEDDTNLNELYTHIFFSEGFDVTTAKNGRDGVQAVIDKKPDLVVLDLVMTQMDGMSVLEEMRGHAWGKEIPVIVFTNLNINDAMQVKFSGYKRVTVMLKVQTTPDQLLEKVYEILNSNSKRLL